jgi:hypothetical protein
MRRVIHREHDFSMPMNVRSPDITGRLDSQAIWRIPQKPERKINSPDAASARLRKARAHIGA